MTAVMLIPPHRFVRASHQLSSRWDRNITTLPVLKPPELNCWNLASDAILCDVEAECQVEITGPTPHNLSRY
ncbi:hypothetical protein [Amphritea sp.]|uniref:hypothetical protein n=1 Tax=Amphritea sp. TaxID=1872502 RepID=UPI003D0969F5